MSRMIICCFPRNRNLRTEFPALTSLVRISDGFGSWAEVTFANGIHGLWDTNDAEKFLALPQEARTGLRGWTGPNLFQGLPIRVRVWMLEVFRTDTSVAGDTSGRWKVLAQCGLTDFFRAQNRQDGSRRRALAVTGGTRAKWDPNTERLVDRRPVHTWAGTLITPVDGGVGYLDESLGSDESIGQDNESSGDVLA